MIDVKMPMPINHTPEWKKLQSLTAKKPNLRTLFKDPSRAKDFSVWTPHIYFDFSRQLVNTEIFKGLLGLARAAGLKEKIAAMYRGDKINVTEKRAALHVALRNPDNHPIIVDGKDVMPEVNSVLDKIKTFSEKVFSGEHKGVTGKKIKNIVSIGIGGSYLGPEYLADACKPYAKEGMKLAFVANVDGTDFVQKTAGMNPEETMFVIVSKTFTTAETMMNAETAKKWMIEKLSAKGYASEDIISKHFVAVSTSADLVRKFGIDEKNNMFGFWDWVGGRYSATSAVGGVPLSLYLGFENFHMILEGANWMDNHYLNAPFAQNIPVISALLDMLNNNFYGWKTRALLPYSQSLGRLPAHTQQVEMESNGKRVDIYGRPVEFTTGEIVMGEPGTNGQHSFYQEMHQGQVVPADFIAFIKLHPSLMLGENTAKEVSHHRELLTNFLAQPDALAFGKTPEEVRKDLLEENDALIKKGKEPRTLEEIEALIPHKVFPGDRPSSSLLLNQLDPFASGLLIAWTEHRAVTKGFLGNYSSSDQWGVELGKVLGVDARKAMLGDPSKVAAFNPSSRTLFDLIMSGKLPS